MKKPSLLLLTGIVVTSLSVAQADQALVDLIKKVKPCVVLIETFDKDYKPLSQGSGFFVNNKGHIVTNHHVLEDAYRAAVKTSSGREYPVEGIVAKDTEADIVKLVVNLPDADITFLNLSVNVPSEGEDIVVIGNPLGFEASVSTGIVSAVRDIPAFGKILQITAPISPGSSGSPVLNTKGEVIGIATFVATKGQNINFAVPSEKVFALKEPEKIPLPKEKGDLFDRTETSKEPRKPPLRKEPRRKPRLVELNESEKLYHKGLKELWQENWAAALVYFQKATAENPQNAEAWFYVGYCYCKLGRHDEAIDAFKQAIRIKPDLAEPHYNLGIAYYNLGRHQEAIESYQQAIRIKPDYAEAHNNLGAAYGKLSRYDEEIEAYKQTIKIKPDFVEAHNNLGIAYRNLGRYQDAIESYQQAIRIKPDLAEPHYNLGFAYGELGRHDEETEAYKQAIRIKPDLADAHCNLGIAYGKLGRYDEAIDAFKQAIRIKPDLADAHCNLGIAYRNLGRYDEAIDAFKQAIRIKPDFGKAHYGLGISYLQTGDKGSALEEYKILKNLDAEQANKLFNSIYK